ncbi:MAG: hypothetical protein UT05_C0003G0057 [Parcubacteria group bacterium GW2011_GWF2_38_76]|nr:MAG: hypothetical protein UT05_C0003G0057 [Parcubacteria group bacterium GW2011_GWF2_38_76]HBM46171.1 hypothetical protein [Patescibacteria group bacterium]
MLDNFLEALDKYTQNILEHLRFKKEIEEKYHITHYYMETFIYPGWITVTKFGISDNDWNKLFRQKRDIKNLENFLELTEEERLTCQEAAGEIFLAECQKK